MNLGNIFSVNKLKVLKTGIIFHKWPPFWLQIKNLFGWKIFHIFCRIYGFINLFWVQSYVIGEK